MIVPNFRVHKGIHLITQRAVQHGLLQYFKQKTNRLLGIKDVSQSNEKFVYEKLNIADLYFLFALYVMGAILSIIVCVAEVLLKTVLVTSFNKHIGQGESIDFSLV